MFLQLLDHLVNAEQLLNSPQAATLLLTPIPGSKAAPEQMSAEELVRVIQVGSHPIRTGPFGNDPSTFFSCSPQRCSSSLAMTSCLALLLWPQQKIDSGASQRTKDRAGTPCTMVYQSEE